MQVLRACLKTNSASFGRLVAAAILSFAGLASLPSPVAAGNFYISLHIGPAFPHQFHAYRQFSRFGHGLSFQHGSRPFFGYPNRTYGRRGYPGYRAPVARPVYFQPSHSGRHATKSNPVYIRPPAHNRRAVSPATRMAPPSAIPEDGIYPPARASVSLVSLETKEAGAGYPTAAQLDCSGVTRLEIGQQAPIERVYLGQCIDQDANPLTDF